MITPPTPPIPEQRERERERASVAVTHRWIAGAAALLASATAGLAQTPASFYATEATGTLKDEIGVFVAMLETLETTGQPAPGADAFLFSHPLANTALFDPVLAARRTVSGTLNFEEACPSATGVQVTAYAGDGTIANPLTDTQATLSHLEAVLSTDAPGVTIGVDGDHLVSQGLPLEGVTAEPIPAQAFVPTPERAAWIADIEWFAIQHAATQDPADDVTNLLLGLPTNAQQLAWSIWDHLFDTGQDEPDDIRLLKAEFGIYGALPVLEITFEKGFILLDALTGEAFGPYADGQPYDPIPLLSNHPEYEPGTPASLIVASTGCPPAQGARWRQGPSPYPYPVPGSNPNYTVPVTPPAQPPNGWPQVQFPINSYPARPGRSTDFHCRTVGGGCRCSAYRQTLSLTGRIVWEVEICFQSGPCGSGSLPSHTPPGRGNCTTYHWE